MERISKKHRELAILLCLFCSTAYAQLKSGVESYNFISKSKEYLWMPVVHYQTKKGFYSEMRYNYDDAHTFSLYGGKTISGGNDVNYVITPMAGFSVGDFRSMAIAVKAEINYQKFFFSSEMQYSHSLDNDRQSFFFGWPEAGIDISKFLFAGAAVQYTFQKMANDFEPGFFIGFNLKNICIPVYVFNPFQKNSYLVIGLNYEYDLKKKNK